LTAAVLGAALLAPATANAAPPLPFGHACAPQSGVLFCPTAADAQRVPSWDGVPLDVDVTLPATGDGPFPTIVILHGFGADKTAYEAITAEGMQVGGTVKTTAYHNNNTFYAQRGYAVVNYSARGFGRSCGKTDSRTAPACDRGWLHLADQRYEGRDTQYLLGLLVDQGVAQAGALGVTGESYGAGQTEMLARLRNRVRMPNGSYAPWTSPNGTPLAFKAAWSRWGWADLAQSLTPNGRSSGYSPAGVEKQSYVDGLYLLSQFTGFLAPVGADQTADLTAWKAEIDKGEPYGAKDRSIYNELTRYHSMVGVSGTAAPLLAQDGWRDELFPASEGLRTYDTLRGQKGARVALQLGDVGHSAGSNKVGTNRLFNDQAAAWFDALLKGSGKPLANGTVTALTSSCPVTAKARGPYRSTNFAKLHPGKLVVKGGRHGQKVTSTGGNPATALAFDQRSAGDACKTVKKEHAKGTAIAQRKARRAFTLLGLPTVKATIKTKGKNGFVAARLWDVFGGKQRLVSRGVYRLKNKQKGKISFQLFGNAYDFKRGHVAKIELVGRDPNYLRTSNSKFSLSVKKLSVTLPTRQKRPR
jgi:predicted acyl esterase